MKKYFKSLLLAIVVIATINGCKKDETNNPTTPPSANFNLSGDNDFAPRKVIFINQSSNAISYSWDFGDGQTSSEASPNHIYSNGGTFNVTLTATNSVGQNVINKTVVIKNAPTKLKVNSVLLRAMSFIDGSGAGWDTFNGPDVYFKVSDDNDVNYFTSGTTYTDLVATSLPVIFTTGFPFTFTNLDYQYSLEFWDKDSPDLDDYIGGFYFKVRNKMPMDGSTYPTAIDIESSTSPLKFTINVEWLP